MNLTELFLIAIGLSMDAFAVSICIGLTMNKATLKKSFTVGAYFGIFQALMPLAGYNLATRFADKIVAFDHWIAFVLLGFIGCGMISGSFKKEESQDTENHGKVCPEGTYAHKEYQGKAEASLAPKAMLPLALATSIDALAVGVSFAFLRVSIIPAVFSIGVTTLVFSIAGAKIGNLFGTSLKSKAELAGGIILVLMGIKILIEHLGV